MITTVSLVNITSHSYKFFFSCDKNFQDLHSAIFK